MIFNNPWDNIRYCQQLCVNTQVELQSVNQISFQVCQNIVQTLYGFVDFA